MTMASGGSEEQQTFNTGLSSDLDSVVTYVNENECIYSDLTRPEGFLRQMDAYRQSELFTDFTLIVQDERFPVHRIMLASVSPRLNSLILSCSEKGAEEAIVADLDPCQMSAILDYAYRGQLDMTPANVKRILQAATLYEIPFLKTECERFMNERKL